jgi:hypothetical protein
MTRARISVTTEVVVKQDLATQTTFTVGQGVAPSLREAVNSAIFAGDCDDKTAVLLDGRYIGNLWQLGLIPRK